jgi:hypothetical protein
VGAELKPVERGVLLVLMAEARPLRELADLKAVYGLAIKAHHRTKLQSLGLITTTKTPYTHVLSQKGWQWAEEELSATRPKGTMGMGPLYALLRGLQTHIQRHGYTLKDIFSATPNKTGGASTGENNIKNALAETAWVEADQALARALQQTPALREAIREPTELGLRLRNQIGAIVQAVRASAAKRELEIEGDPGSETAFDPVKHAQDDPRVKSAKRVRIITPTVFQGRGTARRIMRVADVEPA